jgi:hypothetical protein
MFRQVNGTSRFRRVLVVTAVSAVVAAACGSEPSELEAYYESLRKVTTTYAVDIAELPVATTNGSLDDVRAYFLGVGDALERARSSLGEISPPAEVEDLHPDLTNSLLSFAILTDWVSDRAETLETREDLFALANDPVVGVAKYNAMEAEMVAACGELQAAADAGDVDVDLQCSALASE